MDRKPNLRCARPPRFGTIWRAVAASSAVLAAAGGTALAQSGAGASAVSQPVVQPLPSREALRLNAALSKLGRNPSNVDALIEAGDAASEMGDFEAATGFYKRAQQIAKDDPRVTAGLASALTLAGEPYSAIPMFAEAERAGALASSIAANRGLAYDLVGDPATAQRNYQLALAMSPSDEVSRRLAISLAISGDARGVERVLLPLLRRQDKAAWRARAFSLAILGKTDEAIKITGTLLPPRLAEGITPYLGYMPRLTPAQQAAAANLGKFPRASEIGRDDPRVAQFGGQPVSRPQVASLDKNLVPAGAPLGSGSEQQSRTRSADRASEREAARLARQAEREAARQAKQAEREISRQAKRVAPPEPKPARQTGPAEVPALAAVTAAPAAPPTEIPAAQSALPSVTPASPASTPVRPVAPPAPSAPVAGPGFDLASLPNSTQASVPGARPPVEQPFGTVFGDLGKPVADAAPASGAVDIRKIEAARPKPAPPKPAPPSHPSRIWVQLGIGQEIPALAFDWRRMQRKAADVFAGRKAYVSKLNQTNRMLTGPFESNRSANEFIAELRKAGIEGPYIWTSPAGQVVDAL